MSYPRHAPVSIREEAVQRCCGAFADESARGAAPMLHDLALRVVDRGNEVDIIPPARTREGAEAEAVVL